MQAKCSSCNLNYKKYLALQLQLVHKLQKAMTQRPESSENCHLYYLKSNINSMDTNQSLISFKKNLFHFTSYTFLHYIFPKNVHNTIIFLR